MNVRKIVLSLATVVTAGSVLAGATYALFSDTATSQDNYFSTGNADLLISADNDGNPAGTYVNSIVSPLANVTNIAPGFDQTYSFWLKNGSTSAISLALVTTFDDVVTTGNAAIKDNLMVGFTCYSDTDSNGSLEVAPYAVTGTFSVSAWDAGSDTMGTLAPNDSTDNGMGADEFKCDMRVTLPLSVDSTFSNSSVRFDGVFNATQV